MKFLLKVRKFVTGAVVYVAKRQEGFGMYEILGVAAVLIVAAFVVIPGFRTFANSVMTAMTSWWTTTVSVALFPTS